MKKLFFIIFMLVFTSAYSADTNWAIDGGASATGDGSLGSPSDVIDDDTDPEYGETITVYVPLDSDTDSYYAEVDLGASRTLTKIELLHYGITFGYPANDGGSIIDVEWEIELYYSGSWHSVGSGSHATFTLGGITTDSVSGNWSGVTKVRSNITFTYFADGDISISGSHYINELRAWEISGGTRESSIVIY